MRPKTRKIKERELKCWGQQGQLYLNGYLEGKDTYIDIHTKNDSVYGVIEGNKLYRLAKSIVRQFEE
jgi:hypothetical protein